jgi:hypothetical protein
MFVFVKVQVKLYEGVWLGKTPIGKLPYMDGRFGNMICIGLCYSIGCDRGSLPPNSRFRNFRESGSGSPKLTIAN